ncbi:Alpha/Beta hydrolase protein [Boletus reticuloceps]|uniref:Alpha/Beta hydrolase protein n=1 Tax=Boletus reticuloceps TaxID=495285 RepID=A0A8I3A2E7_9AGAM|nr:Alpha/Beta hydrolase protein [Boletus reticuloceps]
MFYELREQPWFGLYLTYQVVSTTLFRLPYWYLSAYPLSWRPRPSWSVTRTVLVRLFSHLFRVTQKTGPLVRFPTHHAIAASPGVKGVWVNPVPHLITGAILVLAHTANITCARIPGYWIDRDTTLSAGAPPQPGDKVLYRLHGGSYIQLSAHPVDPTANIARGILAHSPRITRTFAIEYRLSSAEPCGKANSFPAALLDALAGYVYLVEEVGFRPEDVIVQGDSAGGNLALAMMRYLRDYANYHPDLKLPRMPGGLLLLSPWADLGASHEGPLSSLSSPFSVDYTGTVGRDRKRAANYGKTAFLGPFGLGFAEKNAWVSPASLHACVDARFDGFPRTLVCAGGAEPLLDSIRTLWWKMARDMGEGEGKGRVAYHEAKDALHDHILFTWHEPEAGETLTRIASWIDNES